MPNCSNEPDFFDRLPNEILVLIFKNLSVTGLFRMAMLSKRYNHLMYVDDSNNGNDDDPYLKCTLHFLKELFEQYKFIKNKKTISFSSKESKKIRSFLESFLFLRDNKKRLNLFFLKPFVPEIIDKIDKKVSVYIKKANKSDFLFVLKHLYASEKAYYNIIGSILDCVVQLIFFPSYNVARKFQSQTQYQLVSGCVTLINTTVSVNFEINKSVWEKRYLQNNIRLKFDEHISEISRKISTWLANQIKPVDKANSNYKKNIKENENFKENITLDQLKEELKDVLHVNVFSKLKETASLLEKKPKNPKDKRQCYLIKYTQER